MRHCYFLLIFLMLAATSLHGQTTHIDSLKNELSKPYPDSVLSRILDRLAFDFLAVDPGSDFEDAKNGGAIASGHHSNGIYDLKQMQQFLEYAIILCQEIDLKGPQARFTKCLSEVYSAMGNHRKALEVYKQYVAVSESLQAQAVQINVATLEYRRDIELKDKDLTLEKQKLEISKLETINKQHLRTLFLAGNLLLVVIAIVLYKRLRSRSRGHNRVLSEIAAIQSHEVRGPVARILGLVNLFDSKNADTVSNEEIIRYIQSSAQELDMVIQKVVDKTYETRKLPAKTTWSKAFLERLGIF